MPDLYCTSTSFFVKQKSLLTNNMVCDTCRNSNRIE